MALTQQQHDFLSDPDGKLFAILATLNPDGTVQQTVMWYELRDDAIVMNTTASRVKSRNLGRDKRVSICVPDGYRYMTVTGTAELDSDPEVARASIRRLIERYSDETDPVKREAESAEQAEMYMKSARVQITVPIEHIVMWGF